MRELTEVKICICNNYYKPIYEISFEYLLRNELPQDSCIRGKVSERRTVIISAENVISYGPGPILITKFGTYKIVLNGEEYYGEKTKFVSYDTSMPTLTTFSFEH